MFEYGGTKYVFMYYSKKCFLPITVHFSLFLFNYAFMILGPQLWKEVLGSLSMRDVIQQWKWEEDYENVQIG